MPDEFLEAVRAGDAARVRALLRKDPDLKDARTPEGIHVAVEALYRGHVDVAQAILEKRPVLDLHAAATVGDLARVRELVEADPLSVATYSVDGFPPLGLAAHLGHADIVEYLLSKGADANQVSKNRGRFTALTGAVSSGHASVVRKLLEAGADPNYWYQGGFTPVLEAAMSGNLPILELLVASGGDVTVETEQGKTALSIAAENHHPDVEAWLRTHGAK